VSDLQKGDDFTTGLTFIASHLIAQTNVVPDDIEPSRFASASSTGLNCGADQLSSN